MRAGHFVLAYLMLSGSAAAQPAASAGAHLAGVVVDAQTGVALRRARVAVNAGSTRPAPVFTDQLGRFSLHVPAEMTLSITKAGYAQEIVKVAKPRDIGPADDVRIAMKRGAAITGRVVDGTGAPVVAATVVASAASSETRGGTTPRIFTALTDDLGEFRIGGLPEGPFQIGVRPSSLDARRAAQTGDTLEEVAAAGESVDVRPGDSIDVGQLAVRADGVTVAGGPVGPVRKSGRVTGQVRDSRGRAARVVVRLTRSGSVPLTKTSDPQGRFRFDAVPAGSYLAEISRPGLPTVQYGQRLSGQAGTPIDVREGSTVNGIDFVLGTGTAIAGTIWDEYGEPVQGATIRALQIQRVDGRTLAASVPGIQMRPSDDRGGYRLFGLLPGRYLVVADLDGSPGRGDPAPHGGYGPTFYPGVTNVSAALPVALDRGDAIGIDFSFQDEPAARVAGTAHDSEGRPVSGGVLLAVSERSGAIMLEPRLAPLGRDGSFAFENVPAGDYVLQAIAPSVGNQPATEPGKPVPRPPTEFGMQYVTVDDTDPPPALLRTTAGVRLRGRMTVDGPPSTPPAALTVWPFPANFDLSSMIGNGASGLTKKDDGSFEVVGVTGPRRFVLMGSVDGWYLKGARVGRIEAMDTPFDFGMAERELDDIEIVVSSSVAAIFGSVTRADGEPVADCSVLLFSTDSRKWYRSSQALKLGRLSQNREFRFDSLPPGSYYLVALTDASDLITSGSWQDRATLENLRRSATHVTVAEGEVRSISLRMTSDR
jgi:hypothetical protein